MSAASKIRRRTILMSGLFVAAAALSGRFDIVLRRV
jgi:hypothetical protein